MNLSEQLKKARENAGLTQKQVSLSLHIPPSTISKYENGLMVIPAEVVNEYAALCDTTTDDLFGRPSSTDPNLRPLAERLSAGGKIPVLGKVPAGIPIEAIEDIVDEIDISAKLANDSHEYFALLVSGDSMYPEYMDGDIVIVRKQETAETGDDVVAYVNGYDATLKRLVRSERGITLRPLNPAHEPRTFTNEEIMQLPVRLAGVVVEQRRNRR